jgi:hypothetical protein
VYKEFPLSTLKTFATEFGSFSSLTHKKKNKTKSWHFYYDVETFFNNNNNEVWQLFVVPFYHDIEKTFFSTTKFLEAFHQIF